MKSFGKRAAGERLERMQASLRWVGEGFRNLHPILPGLRDHGVPRPTISDFLCGGERRVPLGPLPSVDPRAGWAKPVASGLRATWLGHSTVLIEIDGFRVLTDPVWGARASPSRLLGPEALPAGAGPAARAAAARPGDRLARPLRPPRLPAPIRALAKTDVPFVTSLGVGAHLEAWGVPAGAHHRARLVGAPHAARRRAERHRRAVAALLRARAEGPQRDAVVVAGHPHARSTRCSSAATPA